jgi:DNA-binding transcriptional LysR family regulator
MAELGDETFLLREAGSGTRIDTQRLFEGRDLKLNVGMELRSSGAIKQGVAADLGIAVIPLGAIELEIAARRLVVLDVVGFPVHRHWYLARRAGSHPSAAAAALWNFMLEYRNDLVQQLETAEAVRGGDGTALA